MGPEPSPLGSPEGRLRPAFRLPRGRTAAAVRILLRTAVTLRGNGRRTGLQFLGKFGKLSNFYLTLSVTPCIIVCVNPWNGGDDLCPRKTSELT